MPLLKKTLETNIKAAFKIGSAAGSEEKVAELIATAIHTYVSAADVNTTVTGAVVTGLPAVVGVPISGTATGAGKGTLS